jgi:hypothetical protein
MLIIIQYIINSIRGNSKSSVKVVKRLLGAKSVYIIVVMTTAQNDYTKETDKMAMVTESRIHEWR